MSIILTEPEKIKTHEFLDVSDSDIDDAATELLGLWEFVVESYEIDEVCQLNSMAALGIKTLCLVFLFY